jgi:hypothetical protein
MQPHPAAMPRSKSRLSPVSWGRRCGGDPLEQMTDEQFERHALDIIHREFGVYGLARFLRVYRAGTGDYTRDRHQWLQGLTVQELAKEFEGHHV